MRGSAVLVAQAFKRADTAAAWLPLSLVRAYRLLLSPWLGSSCRFTPTCSAYALQALQTHGASTGSYLAARRILRCHPWCAGGFDPVPAHTGASASAGQPTSPEKN